MKALLKTDPIGILPLRPFTTASGIEIPANVAYAVIGRHESRGQTVGYYVATVSGPMLIEKGLLADNCDTISQDEIREAISMALVSIGRHKGKLKAKCPPVNSLGAAAWTAIQFHANPYKVGMGHMMFMDGRKRAIHEVIRTLAAKVDVRNLDRDREALENLGVW